MATGDGARAELTARVTERVIARAVDVLSDAAIERWLAGRTPAKALDDILDPNNDDLGRLLHRVEDAVAAAGGAGLEDLGRAK